MNYDNAILKGIPTHCKLNDELVSRGISLVKKSIILQVPDAAYINPFKRKRSVVRYNDVETNEVIIT